MSVRDAFGPQANSVEEQAFVADRFRHLSGGWNNRGMTDAPPTLLVVIAFLFAISGIYIVLVGLVFDVWVERRHRHRTSLPLVTPPAPVPLMTPFQCGLVLLLPGYARARDQQSSIHLARPLWRWLAIGHVPMVIVFSLPLLGALWLLPGR
mgnify:CR=1 FL=1